MGHSPDRLSQCFYPKGSYNDLAVYYVVTIAPLATPALQGKAVLSLW